jgi:DNA-binding XRE family transcriptional regulator
MTRQTIVRNGKRFALIEPAELRRLERLAARERDFELPPFPPANARGNRPAVEFARVSIARKIIEQRQALGISQQELARLAGVRQETISRLESGKHSPTIRTVDKIDQALQRAERRRKSTSSKRSSVQSGK